MKRRPSLWQAWAMALALLTCTDAGAATATANVTNASTSNPKLNGTGDAWVPFSNAVGDPNASKPIRVLYLSGDDAVYPLDASGATVQLRAKGGGPMIGCTYSVTVPVLTSSNAGTCTFRIVNTAGHLDTLEVYHLGMLSGDIRLTASGIAASGGGNSVDPYDSDTVLPGTPPAPTLSRKPARLVLIFDKSGSMAWSAQPDGDPTCGALYSPAPDCQRWRVLRRATDQMISVAKAYQLPGDQLGVVFFDSDATNTGGLAAMTDSTLDAVLPAIDGHSPGGSTSIGDGIENLLPDVTGSDNADFNNTMLLFTDGQQNTSKFVVWDGVDLRLNTTNNPIGGTLVRPLGKQLRICPFRLQLDDPTANALLQQIADDSECGMLNVETTLDNPPVGTIQYFLQVLDATLFGDKLELIGTAKGEQAAPGNAPPAPIPMPFKTGKQDLAFTLLLGWDHGFQVEGRPTLKLSKDGVDFDPLHDPHFLVSGGPDHLAVTLRTPFCNAAGKCVTSGGDWKLQVTRTLARGDGHWSLFVLGDNASLDTSYHVSQAQAGVGEPLQLKATLTEGGAPLTGLPAGTVRAFVSGPSAGLGNVLSASKAKPGKGPQADTISAAGLKVKAMLADPTERAKLLAALELGAEQGIPLSETSPGVYTAAFPATLAEGVYRVRFRVDSSSPANGAFTRAFDTSYIVQVQPDDTATAKTLTFNPASSCPPNYAGGCMQLTLRPVDARGNLVGPGKSTSFYAKPFDGGIVGPVVDNLDGSYSLVIGYANAGTHAPTLQIAGLPLHLPDSVSPAGSHAGAGWHPWWLWLLLLLLVIVILVWRRRTP